MQRPASWVVATAMLGGLGCGAVPSRASAPRPPAPSIGACNDLGPSPFQKARSSHILIADFAGHGRAESNFADAVTRQIVDELHRFREEVLRNPTEFDVDVPAEALEVQRVRCIIRNHDEARRVARALGADVVLWGKAYLNEGGPSGSVQTRIQVGDVTTGAASTVNIGVVRSKPYSIRPSATLHRSEVDLFETGRAMGLESLAELDLPALQSTRPFVLVQFALGLHFYEQKNHWIAARFFRKSADEILATNRDADDLHLALGSTYLHLPDLERSIEHSRRALASLGNSGTIKEATLRNNIGVALKGQGEYADALEEYRRALSIVERSLGQEHPRVACILNNIGTVLQARGDHARALEHYRRALGIDEKMLGDHPEVAIDLGNIGSVLLEQGDQDGAIEHFRRALTIDERVLGREHPSVARDLNRIGTALRELGDFKGAIDHHRRALTIDEKVQGKNHPDVARDLSSIGQIFMARGDYAVAADQFRRACEILEKKLGPEHVHLARELNNVGRALQAQEQHEGALESYRRSLAIEEKARHPNHLAIATVAGNVASVLHTRREYATAVEQYGRALQIEEQALGPDHPRVASRLYQMGQALQAQGDLAEALARYLRARRIDEQVYGPDDGKVAARTHRIAGLLAAMGKHDDALAEYRRALAIEEKAYGPEDPRLLPTLGNIVTVLRALRHHSAVLGELRRKERIQVQDLGPGHADVQATRRQIALALAERSGWSAGTAIRGAVVIQCAASCGGLEQGDWIKTIGSTEIRSGQHFTNLTRATPLGSVVSLVVVRNDRSMIVDVPGGPLNVTCE